jgi:hypothetical protein
MNWLSRFLHIKPASKTLCFHIGRGKVRQDLVRLLRDWQRFGVRDVSFDRRTNVINARVDKSNRKYHSRSGFVFSAWYLQNHRFDVELLAAKHTSSRSCTFSVMVYANLVLTIAISQTSKSSQYTSPLSSLSSWSMVVAPTCALLDSRKRGVQRPVSAKSSISLRTSVGLDACWSKMPTSKLRCWKCSTKTLPITADTI